MLCILLISANKSVLLPTGDWINDIKSLILFNIVNSQTCELERNARLIDLSGQPWVACQVSLLNHPGGHTGRERSAALLLQWGQVGSDSVQMGAASILDKEAASSWEWHPCWIWMKAQLYIMEGQQWRKSFSAQLAKAKQP